MRLICGDKTYDIEGIKARDWLLIIGLCMAPMTGLRIWKVGPGEILCLLWGIRYLINRFFKSNILTKFFILFLLSLGIGSVVGFIVAPKELRILELLTWIYLGIIAISVSLGLSTNSLAYNERLLKGFSYVSTIWYLLLYFYGIYVDRYILGAPIWYGYRFSAGATNPHQIAVLLCGLIFIFVRRVLLKDKIVVSIFCISVCLYLMIQTGSSTGILAVAVSFLFCIYLFVIESFPRYKYVVLAVISFLLICLLIVCFSRFWDIFIDWVAQDRNGLGRLDIFASFPEAFSKSPIFGLGPGVHGRNGLIEFHNTYLEILVASGIVGGCVFVVFTVRLLKRIIHSDWRLFPVVMAMYAYGLAGFAMRRLVFWGIISFVIVLSEQKIVEKNKLINGESASVKSL